LLIGQSRSAQTYVAVCTRLDATHTTSQRRNKTFRFGRCVAFVTRLLRTFLRSLRALRWMSPTRNRTDRSRRKKTTLCLYSCCCCGCCCWSLSIDSLVDRSWLA